MRQVPCRINMQRIVIDHAAYSPDPCLACVAPARRDPRRTRDCRTREACKESGRRASQIGFGVVSLMGAPKWHSGNDGTESSGRGPMRHCLPKTTGMRAKDVKSNAERARIRRGKREIEQGMLGVGKWGHGSMTLWGETYSETSSKQVVGKLSDNSRILGFHGRIGRPARIDLRAWPICRSRRVGRRLVLFRREKKEKKEREERRNGTAVEEVALSGRTMLPLAASSGPRYHRRALTDNRGWLITAAAGGVRPTLRYKQRDISSAATQLSYAVPLNVIKVSRYTSG